MGKSIPLSIFRMKCLPYHFFLYICSPQLKRRGIINLKILNNDKGRIDA